MWWNLNLLIHVGEKLMSGSVGRVDFDLDRTLAHNHMLHILFFGNSRNFARNNLICQVASVWEFNRTAISPPTLFTYPFPDPIHLRISLFPRPDVATGLLSQSGCLDIEGEADPPPSPGFLYPSSPSFLRQCYVH